MEPLMPPFVKHLSSTQWAAMAVMLFATCFAPMAVRGQDEKENAPPETKPVPAAAKPVTPSDTAAPPQENMLIWVYNAEGIFFFPQLGISMIVIGMIVLYSMQLRTTTFIPDQFLQHFDALFKDKKFQEAFEFAKNNDSYLGKMVSAGIGRLSVGFQQSLDAAQEVSDDESMKHEHRLSYLAMIANLATMVGLLGTVWGMVASFMVISRSDTAPKPSELATGVSQALCTTVAGLVQAIPATLAFTILKNRAARLGFEASMKCEQIMSRFVGIAKRPPTGGASAPAQAPTIS